MDSTITPTWRLRACNPSFAPVDPIQISDVVMHLRYTARDGGEAHRQSTLSGLPDALSALSTGFAGWDTVAGEATGIAVGLSATRDAPDAWFAVQEGSAAELEFTIGAARQPYFTTGQDITITAVHVLVRGTAPTGTCTVALDGGTAANLPAFATWGDTGLHLSTLGSLAVTAWPDTVSLDFANSGGAYDWTTASEVTIILQFTVETAP